MTVLLVARYHPWCDNRSTKLAITSTVNRGSKKPAGLVLRAVLSNRG